ncbi:MAG TPA: hypothetical protein VKI45_11060 [Allosphingosinicella sp.]|nr:hypothetical protein [Allosphingosinicella sp.]
MLTIAMLLAASQVPPADIDDLSWRRFVRTAVATDTPFSTRMSELHRSVRLLPAGRPGHRARGIGGPSGL